MDPGPKARSADLLIAAVIGIGVIASGCARSDDAGINGATGTTASQVETTTTTSATTTAGETPVTTAEMTAAIYESYEDILGALEEGGFTCDAVSVTVRDREGQQLVDPGLPPDLSDDEREFFEQSMLRSEETSRLQGIMGWSTCWWGDGRLDILIFDSEQTRIRNMVFFLGFGCASDESVSEIPYVHGDRWIVDLEYSIDEMGGIANAVGGRLVEASCADIFSAMESWESSYSDFEAIPIEELRSVLGE